MIIWERYELSDMQISITETNICLEVYLRGPRFQFDEALNALKHEILPPYRRFNPEHRCWSIDLECRTELERWARRMRYELGASVVFDRKHPPSNQLTTNPLGDAYATLYLLPTAPPELVKAAYRCLALMHHPDRGGQTETMQQINNAYARLADRVGTAVVHNRRTGSSV
jgi:hypothetical protein